MFARGTARRAAVLALAVAALAASPALAQVDQIPADIVRAQAGLTPDQARSLADYIGRHSGKLDAQDPQDIKADRSALIAPLAEADASPSFRLEYSRAISGKLEQLAKNTRESVAISALVIAGRLGTDNGVAIAESQLARPEPAVRFAAASALATTIDALKRQSPAIQPERIDRTIEIVGKAIDAETDPSTLDALVRALVAAMEVDRPRFETVRSAATVTLASHLGQKVQALKGDAVDDVYNMVLVRAATAMRDALSTARSGAMPIESIKAVATYAGDLLAHIVRQAKAGTIGNSPADDDPTRQSAVQLASVAQSVAYFALTAAGANPEAPKLADFLKSGRVDDDARFADGLAQLANLMSKPPLELDPNRFR